MQIYNLAEYHRMTTRLLSQTRTPDQQSGSVLLSLVVVLVVMAATSLALQMANHTKNKLSEYDETKRRMERVAQALRGYWLTRNCPSLPGALPTYANGALPDNNINAGKATGGLATNATLPWKELGLAEQDALDAWGRRFTYVRQPTSLTDNGTPQVALWVLVSHGPSGLGAWLPTGQRLPLPPIANPNERNNTQGANFFKQSSNTPSGINAATDPTHFDDLLIYGTGTTCNDWNVVQ